MTKENAKDFLPLLQAMAEGKTVQHLTENEWIDMDDVCFDDDVENYHIKPEYVPFDTTEELIDCWYDKIDITRNKNDLRMPYIWVKSKHAEAKYFITTYGSDSVCVSGASCSISLNVLYNRYTFLDDSPIGKIKE